MESDTGNMGANEYVHSKHTQSERKLAHLARVQDYGRARQRQRTHVARLHWHSHMRRPPGARRARRCVSCSVRRPNSTMAGRARAHRRMAWRERDGGRVYWLRSVHARLDRESMTASRCTCMGPWPGRRPTTAHAATPKNYYPGRARGRAAPGRTTDGGRWIPFLLPHQPPGTYNH